VLISKEYAAEQQKLHEDRPDYGAASVKYAPIVSSIIEKLKVQQLLDYGCGKGRLFKNLNVGHEMQLQAYDPGVPAFSGEPSPSEMVACIDVLEHIEPEYLQDVIDDLERVTKEVLFASVHMGPAGKTLSDGRNAHLTQEPVMWWLPQLMDRFDLQQFTLVSPVEFFVVMTARPEVEI